MRQPTRLVIALGLAAVLATPVALALRPIDNDQLFLDLGWLAAQTIHDLGSDAGAAAVATVGDAGGQVQSALGEVGAGTDAAQEGAVGAGSAATASSAELTQQVGDAIAAARDAKHEPIADTLAAARIAQGFQVRGVDRALGLEAAALLPLPGVVASLDPGRPDVPVEAHAGGGDTFLTAQGLGANFGSNLGQPDTFASVFVDNGYVFSALEVTPDEVIFQEVIDAPTTSELADATTPYFLTGSGYIGGVLEASQTFTHDEVADAAGTSEAIGALFN